MHVEALQDPLGAVLVRGKEYKKALLRVPPSTTR